MDMHTHDFDLARWFMKDEVYELYVNDSNLLNLKYNMANLKDHTIISIKFNSGTLGVIDGNWNAAGGYDVRSEISGSNGFITVGQLHYQPITLFSEGGLTNVSTYQTVNNNPHFMYRFGEAYFLEDESFVDSVINNKEPLINVNDGFEAIRIADAAQRSSDNKSIVKL
ncbi:MAG: Gfo/Idh/MocA family oxidoreductase [Actinobacteria bacterium]|nr:Gfo/Idh/MocA family oxidoreductase [Actinomycetota bacterium]